MADEPQADAPLPKRRSPGDKAEGDDETSGISSGREAYNVVSDTVTGVNVRFSDNCFQGLFILASLVVGAGIGAIFAFPEGILVGGFIGVLAGLFLSGVALMIYRGMRHVRGKHD